MSSPDKPAATPPLDLSALGQAIATAISSHSRVATASDKADDGATLSQLQASPNTLTLGLTVNKTVYTIQFTVVPGSTAADTGYSINVSTTVADKPVTILAVNYNTPKQGSWSVTLAADPLLPLPATGNFQITTASATFGN